MLRCVILDDYQRVALEKADWARLDGSVECVAIDHHIGERAALVATLRDAEIIVAMRERTPFDAALLAELPKLKLLITTGAYNASIDGEAAARQGVVVCGTGNYPGTTAELAWGLILSLARHIPDSAAGMREGGPWQPLIGHALHGKTLGILGWGNLGKRVAAVGRAFGMEILAHSRSLTPEATAAAEIGHAATLPALMAGSDIVSIHLRLTPETRGMIGAAELGAMRPGAILVNTSRGPIVDEAALLDALASGHIRAGLDVYDVEPLPVDHPLRTAPGVVLTPHVGYVTHETYDVFYPDALADIEAWLAGAPIRVING
ncbi:D-2-hydroxyacid dehydrogenase family protein [Acuticoccus sp. M5D2P5]|uniref:D-2-hydroxyacid dehydrogenase family protein n=1 Tax=Acuticoccus kalidii TaxID=2910977 RepID=UPI001F32B3FC|nr:D-2-hydroxyacid dehydrogenase family protein [Acuticoccus kalidii]MCF3931906.1 D-2-hydroxyacid dehydrogenase family protein [Acuticoccus kalidii]